MSSRSGERRGAGLAATQIETIASTAHRAAIALGKSLETEGRGKDGNLGDVGKSGADHLERVLPPQDSDSLRDGEIEVSAARLVYLDQRFPEYSGRLILVYAVESISEGAKFQHYLDSETGRVIASVPEIIHTEWATLNTQHSGRQRVKVDFQSGQYKLRDSERKISVGDRGQERFTSRTPEFDYGWQGPYGAMPLDIYFGIEKLYELHEQSFNWLGLDGAGKSMNGEVIINEYGYTNAYWNGESSYFGSGDCHYLPITSLDVVGHEFSHGITENTSDLFYFGESGALNEGFSDIMGKALEYNAGRATFTWELAERSGANNEFAPPFRSMKDPKAFGKPACVRGDFWDIDAGVHHSSGPLGHWFQLLVDGGSGVNDLGQSYSVTGLGMAQAYEIAFALNTAYLTEFNTYRESHQLCMDLVESAYSAQPGIVRSVEQAWIAIGAPFTDDPAQYYYLFMHNTVAALVYCRGDTLDFRYEYFNGHFFSFPAGTIMRCRMEFPTDTIVWSDTLPTDLGPSQTIPMRRTIPAGLIDTTAVVPVRFTVGDNVRVNSSPRTLHVNSEVYMQALRVTSDTDRGVLCAAEDLDAYYQLRLWNYSCNPVPATVTYRVTGSDQAILYEGTYYLPAPVAPGTYRTLQYRLPTLTAAAADSVILFGDGVRLAAAKANLATVAPFRPGYVHTFEPENEPLESTYFELGGGVKAMLRDGNHWGVTSGIRTALDRPFPCLNRWENSRLLHPWWTMTGCVDSSFVLTGGTIAFDYMELASPLADSLSELEPYLRDLTVDFSLSSHGNSYLNNWQSVSVEIPAPGQETAVSIPFPAGFTGAMQINMFAYRGVLDFPLLDPALQNYDYVLIDNIEVKGIASSIESIADSQFEVFPNPVKDVLHVRLAGTSESAARSLTVYDIHGRAVATSALPVGSPSSREVTLPVGHLLPGVYFVFLHDDSGRSVSRRFVVHH